MHRRVSKIVPQKKFHFKAILHSGNAALNLFTALIHIHSGSLFPVNSKVHETFWPFCPYKGDSESEALILKTRQFSNEDAVFMRKVAQAFLQLFRF